MPTPINLNFTTSLYEQFTPSDACWNWCAEQAMKHQSNIDVNNLGVIAVAMVALVLYNISVEWSDEICNKLEISQEQLRFAGHTVVFFAFVLLAAFLVYYLWFN